MESSIGLPIVVIAACIISSTFFWCTYRHQSEPPEGRGSEDSLNAENVAQMRQEIYLTRIRVMLAEESEASEDPESIPVSEQEK
tara:strand:+ start:4071 stop:4322 length:252 start_codon:yes stop_codon:yes gene_type:complete